MKKKNVDFDKRFTHIQLQLIRQSPESVVEEFAIELFG
jgi:hypothetical protein